MQSTFSELEYGAKKKLTRRDRFLAEIEAVTPWASLIAALELSYPKGERGGPPISLDLVSKGLPLLVTTAANLNDVN